MCEHLKTVALFTVSVLYFFGWISYTDFWVVAKTNNNKIGWANPTSYCLSSNVTDHCQTFSWYDSSYREIAQASASLLIMGYVFNGMCLTWAFIRWNNRSRDYDIIIKLNIMGSLLVTVGLILWTVLQTDFLHITKQIFENAYMKQSGSYGFFIACHVISYLPVLWLPYQAYRKRRDQRNLQQIDDYLPV
jgi:hypothetical protein